MLIADAAYPLSSPAWGPDGHTLFYCRFVPGSPGTDPTLLRGQFEVVVQESLDRQRVVMSLPEITLDRDQVATFCELKGSWSPDGQYLAIPRPGRTAAILIVLPEQGRVLKTLDRASLPSWSPDSSRMAFVRTTRDGSATQTLQVIGHDFGAGRPLPPELSDISEPASWSLDGQSVLVAARRVQVRPQEFDLLRVFVDSGMSTRAMVLHDEGPMRDLNHGLLPLRNSQPPENLNANRMLATGLDAASTNASQRFSLGFDRDQEECVFTADLEGQIPVIGYCNNIRRQSILKKFHPLDINLRIGSLAMHPEAQVVAVRIDTVGGSSPPLLCDLGTTEVKLIAPDGLTRQEWLTTLVATASGLLQTVPQPSLDGQPVERVSLLPAPGEMLEQNSMLIRLRRIGKVARAFLDEPPADQTSAAGDEPVARPQDEYRLFFDYLRGNFKDAEADLDVLASRAATPNLKFRLLALRAQVLQARNQTLQARAVVDYLLKVQGGQTRRVEETPVGMVFTPAEDPGRLWTRYLAQRLIEKSPATKSSPGDNPGENGEGIDLRMPMPMGGFDGRIIDEGIQFPQRGPRLGGFGPGNAPGPGAGRMGGGPFGPGFQRPQRLNPLQPPQPAEPGGPFPRRLRRFNRPGQGPEQ